MSAATPPPPGNAQPDSPKKRRGYFWLSLLGTLLCLFAAYALTTRAARADFLVYDPRLASVVSHEGKFLPYRKGQDGYAINSPWGFHSFDLAPLLGGPGKAHESVWFRREPEGLPEQWIVDGNFGPTPAERYPHGTLKAWKRAQQSGSLQGKLQAARYLQEAAPERLTAKYLLLCALARAGETEEARDLAERWRADFIADPSGRGSWHLKLAENDIEASSPENARLRQEYETFAGIVAHQHWGMTAPRRASAALPETLEWIAGQEGKAPPRYFSDSQFSFSEVQQTLKVAQASATLMLAQGEREQASGLLLGLLSAGLGSCFHVEPLPLLIAAASLSHALDSMGDYWLRSSQTAEGMARDWPRVERALSVIPSLEPQEIVRVQWPHDAAWPPAPTTGFDVKPMVARWKGVETRRELLREGFRARHYLLANGEWPEIGPDGALQGLALDASPPTFDPFAFSIGGGPIRAARDGDDLLLYSVGPDAKDDKSASPIDWDRFGDFSPKGDLVLRLSPESLYDWPGEPGYAYKGMEDFDARYPKGLPEDPFSNARPKSPLRLTTDGTHILWSYGPDGDEPIPALGLDNREPMPGMEVEALWNPAKGSDGDLWVKLQFEEEK